MSVETRIQEALAELKASREDLRREGDLRSGGGGGTSDGMEPRVAKLEADVGHILSTIGDLKSASQSAAADISTIRVSVGKIETQISSLPSKEDISKTIKEWLLLIGGVLTIINLAGLIITRYLPPTP